MTAFSNITGVREAMRRAIRNVVPPPDMLPSEWAEKHIRIPIGNALPGPIRFENAPYQRGMLDAQVQPGVRRVSYMTAAQMGKTTVEQCATGYFVVHKPRSQIFAMPTRGDVQMFLETKLRPMIEANPIISGRMAKQRGREGVNNSRLISYLGGWLMFAWAASPKTLRGRSGPITRADEIDGMDATAEGDPGELLDQRSATFGDQRLRTETSTPTTKGESRIEVAFDEGDQRRFYVACPDCGGAQVFQWENVTWQGRISTSLDNYTDDIGKEHEPRTARYRCEHCASLWDDGMRIAAIRGAEKKGLGWKAAKPFRGHASFHAPEMCSTFARLPAIVQSYLDKIAKDDIQSFINVSLGLPYDEKGERADPDTLMKRREEYTAQVPRGGLFLTAGIDMQMDRLEVEVVAWGLGEESWSVAYRVLWGDPMVGDVWEELDDLLAEKWLHESGLPMSIGSACLDTGGTNSMTQAAYDYAKGKTGRRLFAIKGQGGWGLPVVAAPQRRKSGKKARKVDLFIVGADEVKLIVMRRLAKDKPGPGYCHFPADYEKEYFDGLTAEKMKTRYVKGQPIREWHKADRARNEPLDCRCYAYAALKIVQPSFKRISERMKMPTPQKPVTDPPKTADQLRESLQQPETQAPEPTPENPQEEQQQQPKDTKRRKKPGTFARKKRKNWVNNW